MAKARIEVLERERRVIAQRGFGEGSSMSLAGGGIGGGGMGAAGTDGTRRSTSARGNDFHRQGNLDAAIASYTKAIESDPQYADAYYRRGTINLARGDYDAALADFTKAIKVKSKPSEALLFLSRRDSNQKARLRRGHRRLHRSHRDQRLLTRMPTTNAASPIT